jgi:hypothetical protein
MLSHDPDDDFWQYVREANAFVTGLAVGCISMAVVVVIGFFVLRWLRG